MLLPVSDRSPATSWPARLRARGRDGRRRGGLPHDVAAGGGQPSACAQALAGGLDAVTFASPSAVEAFVAASGGPVRGLPAVGHRARPPRPRPGAGGPRRARRRPSPRPPTGSAAAVERRLARNPAEIVDLP